MKGKHDKDLCDRCRTWKTDCKELFGRDLCPLCHECEEIELKLLRQAEIPQPDWSKANDRL